MREHWTWDPKFNMWTGTFQGRPLGCVYARLAAAADEPRLWGAGFSGKVLSEWGLVTHYATIEDAMNAVDGLAATLGAAKARKEGTVNKYRQKQRAQVLDALCKATENVRWTDVLAVKAHLDTPLCALSIWQVLRSLEKTGDVVKGSKGSGLWRRP